MFVLSPKNEVWFLSCVFVCVVRVWFIKAVVCFGSFASFSLLRLKREFSQRRGAIVWNTRRRLCHRAAVPNVFVWMCVCVCHSSMTGKGAKAAQTDRKKKRGEQAASKKEGSGSGSGSGSASRQRKHKKRTSSTDKRKLATSNWELLKATLPPPSGKSKKKKRLVGPEDAKKDAGAGAGAGAGAAAAAGAFLSQLLLSLQLSVTLYLSTLPSGACGSLV